MAKLQRQIRRPADERGFTLIELLVVIIILGILAAVVVFAVNGVGDKGKSSAVAIDERTLRTAQEAYCARNGRYADGSTLVAEGFLSDEPEYHNVGAQNTRSGTCNGWTYSILPTAKADPGSGKWAPTNPSPFGQGGLKRLQDGRVVHLACGTNFCSGGGSTNTAIWDPTMGQWTTAASTTSHPIDQHTKKYSYAVVLNENCGSNCGKIFVDMQQGWHLFNPNAPAATQWENLGITPYSNFAFSIARLFQFKDVPSTPVNECGQNCGKVLILTNERVDAQIYDPKVPGLAGFTSFNHGITGSFAFDDQMLLPDGRVLIIGAVGAAPKAWLLDPATLQVTLAADPPARYNATVNVPATLPNGAILFTTDLTSPTVGRSDIYTPQAGGPGSWRQPATYTACFTAPAPARWCIPIASLPDGRVLAASSASPDGFSSSDLDLTAWLFDPSTETWSRTADKPRARLLHSVLLDPRSGSCGTFCNKVLAHHGIPGFFPLLTTLYTS